MWQLFYFVVAMGGLEGLERGDYIDIYNKYMNYYKYIICLYFIINI